MSDFLAGAITIYICVTMITGMVHIITCLDYRGWGDTEDAQRSARNAIMSPLWPLLAIHAFHKLRADARGDE